MLLRHVCINDRDIDEVDLLERGFKILSGCRITFDEDGIEGCVRERRAEVENEGLGTFGDGNSDRCEADA